MSRQKDGSINPFARYLKRRRQLKLFKIFPEYAPMTLQHFAESLEDSLEGEDPLQLAERQRNSVAAAVSAV